MANRQDQLFHQIGFLARLKSEIVVDAKEQPTKSWGGCGYIAAMMNIDDVINSLMKQQTRIEDLERRLEEEYNENAEYHRLCGDLEDLYPEIKERKKKRTSSAAAWTAHTAIQTSKNGVTVPVRCGECCYYRQNTKLALSDYMDENFYCALHRSEFTENGYCSYGERKDNG